MNRSNQIVLSVLVLAVLAGGLWMFNQSYGETSQRGYEYSMALFSACNQHDKEKLQQVADLIARDVASGELESRESKWLLDIVDDGLNDRWTKANKAVRKLMNDQVKTAPS